MRTSGSPCVAVFGLGGTITTAFNGASVDLAYSVAIDGNGKIVVAGYSSNGSDERMMANDYFQRAYGMYEDDS